MGGESSRHKETLLRQKRRKTSQRIRTISLCFVSACAVHAIIKNSLLEKRGENIQDIQEQASEKGKPIIVHSIKTGVQEKIEQTLENKPPETYTTIINPVAQNPAMQVITPEATISADKTGKVEAITPKNNASGELPTPTEAQITVDEAIKDAAKKTLPKEELNNPLAPKKD